MFSYTKGEFIVHVGTNSSTSPVTIVSYDIISINENFLIRHTAVKFHLLQTLQVWLSDIRGFIMIVLG